MGRKATEKVGERGGASTSSAAGGSPAPEVGSPASTASTTTQQDEREGSPPRLLIAETPAPSQEAVARTWSTRESIRVRSRDRRARLYRRPRQSWCLSERRCSSALYQLCSFDLLLCIIWTSTLFFSFLSFNSTLYFVFRFLVCFTKNRLDNNCYCISEQLFSANLFLHKHSVADS